MFDPSSWTLPALVVAFLAATGVIAVAGVRLAEAADRLADQSGLGEAFVGALFLGATTSLAGSVTSVTAAWNGHAELAIGNVIGGITAQTAFLGAADVVYRRANLEHAAASVPNLMHAALLVTLLALPLVARGVPGVDLFGIHPVSLVIVAGWAFGLRIVLEGKRAPMWGPRMTRETKLDEPGEARVRGGPLFARLAVLGVLMLVVGGAGYVIARTAAALAAATALSQTFVGAIFTAVATSLPELVTTVSAIRRGALTLAVGGILGGNAFDVLMFAFSDAAYRQGSIYDALGTPVIGLVALGIVMTGILILGLLRRERHGIANIGFESFLVLSLYGTSLVVLGAGGGSATP